VTEVEYIPISRPFISIVPDPDVQRRLTPNHLLLCVHEGAFLPPELFSKYDCYGHKRWKQVLYLAEQFWRCWTLEHDAALSTSTRVTRWPVFNRPVRYFAADLAEAGILKISAIRRYFETKKFAVTAKRINALNLLKRQWLKQKILSWQFLQRSTLRPDKCLMPTWGKTITCCLTILIVSIYLFLCSIILTIVRRAKRDLHEHSFWLF